jgi:hypothetical protein
MNQKITFSTIAFLSISLFAFSQADTLWQQKFEQLGQLLPTPNSYRTASGAPGKDYWQQQADHKINVTLDDINQKIIGSETITYYNNSEEPLNYLWLQLDQNRRADNSDERESDASEYPNGISVMNYYEIADSPDYKGGYNIHFIKDALGNSLSYVIQKTMLRIDLQNSLGPDENFSFNLSWDYELNDRMKMGGRSGYEYFPEDKNYLYAIAQFFPRMAVFSDNKGWQHKQFLGGGEFALTFGSYDVSITLPADMVVAATGDLMNPNDVLSKEQKARFEIAKRTFDKPAFIITPEEALKNESSRSTKTKTWRFQADSVRDFAFAASRKFIWDAMAVDLGEKKPMAMSYYPKEGNPLWQEFSTPVVALTLKTYSKHTITYPYSKAISVHTASLGMEFPMICFNYGRPNQDGSYTDRTKYLMIGVIIHEVGHNFFPMIINSDERLWGWMDEGLNSFTQYLAEQEFEKIYDVDFPHRRGPAEKIIPFMKGEKGLYRPIMTNPEQLHNSGFTAYAKPATALALLRDHIMGPELFDFGMKTYAQRWAFKNPDPADFFRTMEDATAFDLDWFWRGWFYGLDHVDVAVSNLEWYLMPDEKKTFATNSSFEKSSINNIPLELNFREMTPSLYREFRNTFDEEELIKKMSTKNFYKAQFQNIGGLVTPLILKWTFEDGTEEIEKIPAEIWRYNEIEVTKWFIKDKKVVSLTFDPEEVLVDVDVSNNSFPGIIEMNRIEKFKKRTNE